MNMLQRTRNFTTPKLRSLVQSCLLKRDFQVAKISSCRGRFFDRAGSFQLQNVRANAMKTGFKSKYHPISPREATEIRLRERFFDKKELTVDDWNAVRSDAIIEFLIVTKDNFDSIIMNVLLSINNIDLAQSFMSYLKHISHKPNLVTCLKYMLLCSQNMHACTPDVILDTFNIIKTSVDSSLVLDHVTVNCVVHGLCATDQWRKAFVYSKKLLDNNPLLETKNAIISSAMRNGEEAVAWNIMKEWLKPSEAPNVNAINAYIKFASSLVDRNLVSGEYYLSKLLLYLRKKNVIMKVACTEEIKNFFENHPSSWEVSNTKINRLGCCLACHSCLEAADLTLAELQQLQKVFFEKVIKKSDIFLNSTTTEIDEFLNYIKRNKPFDVIVDGLNAAHSVEMAGKNNLARQLLEVVKRLTISSQRVLVLGRKHMLYWPRNIMQSVSKRASMFFTSNISEEDPMVIYSALMSGPNTLFVSSDLMRDHVSNITDPQMVQLFQKWQQSHQIFVSNTENGPAFKGPLKHHISIHGDMQTGWHIPYDDEFVLDPYEELNAWLCIKRTK